MPSARGTKIAEGFSQKLMLEFYDMNLVDKIANRDYQGEINDIGSALNIYNVARISEKNYTGANLTVDDLFENNSRLIIDQYKAFYWREKTLDNWLSYVKDVHSTVATQKANERSRNVDLFVLGFYPDVAAGNRIGTDYAVGTVTVDAVTGAVTGAGGATFSAAMVGRGFKAAGHTKWYRVKSFADTTHIVIEDDLDDVTSAYTGGAIGAGATYTIEAVTPIAVSKANILSYISQCKLKLDVAERNGKSSVPDTDRWMVLPAEAEPLIVQASGIALHVPEVYTDLVKAGMVTMLQNFKIYESNRLTGDNVNGFRVLAGHPSWLTFAEKLLQAEIEEQLIGNFGTAYKDLMVYGAKVTDSRRHFAVEWFVTFTQST